MASYNARTETEEAGIPDFALLKPDTKCTLNGRSVSLLSYPGTKTVHPDESVVREPMVAPQDLVSDLLPMALHTLGRYPQFDQSPLYLLQCDYADDHGRDDGQINSFLETHAGERLIWMPIAANASLMINALKKVLPVCSDSRLRNMTLLYVGDAGLREVLESLAQKSGMNFCFHAFY